MSSPFSDTGAPVVIVGAGLAGLTAGRVLKDAGTDYLILESRDRAGGLCRTESVDGYTFDYTGHLLHLKEGESRDLILELVGDKLVQHTRSASVYVRETLVDYPIQAHFGQLPPRIAKACLRELLGTAGKEVPGDLPFAQWAVRRFGPTLADLFMVPYNSKLYIHPLDEMEISWTSWSIPIPTARELETIGRGEEPPAYGYNASFFYPRKEGIEILPRALARGQEDRILTGDRVARVDTRARTVTLGSGRELSYRRLISTVPLPELLKMAGKVAGLPARTAERLRYSSVLGVCLGLDGPILTPDHWIYFPEPELPFYRIGFPPNFSRDVTPPGCGSLYAEAAYSGGTGPDPDILAERVVETLVKAGLTDPSTGITARFEFAIPCAYVFHDSFRAGNLEAILGALAGEGIFSVGRYGAWEYSAMQDAVQWGLDAAREVLG